MFNKKLNSKFRIRAALVCFVLALCIETILGSVDKFNYLNSIGKSSKNSIDVKQTLINGNQLSGKRIGSPMSAMINRKQIETNVVGTGLETKPYDRKQVIAILRQFVKQGGFRRGYRIKRTVESPAKSTDTGKRPSVLSGGIKKLFGSNQGHYSETYDKIHHSKFEGLSTTTKKPVNETLLRVDVIQNGDMLVQGSKTNRRLMD